MPEQFGLLDRIGIGGTDEEARLRAMAKKNGDGTTRGMERGIAGLLGRFATPGKSRQGGLDKLTASQAGITEEQLAGRRKIRSMVQEDIGDGSFESRIKLAGKVAKMANEAGDFDTVQRTLAQIQDLRTQEQEFNKLKTSNKVAEKAAEVFDAGAGVGTAYYKGKQTAGVMEIQDGVNGWRFNDENGESVWKPFGTDMFLIDPAKDREAPHVALRRVPGMTKKMGQFTDMLVASNSAIRRFDRTMETVVQLSEEGRVEGVLSTPGKIVTWADQAVNTVKGVINDFVPSWVQNLDEKPNHRGDRDWSGKDHFTGRDENGVPTGVAAEFSNPIWDKVALPAWARVNSSAARQHRAQIMELAYMAARLAEPSNRGLSDKDIVNALDRIAGESTNPQVMMRRFAEMMGDALYDVNSMAESFYGVIPHVTKDEMDTLIGGELFNNYRRRQEELFEKYELDISKSGRASFSEDALIGPDFQPRESRLDDTDSLGAPGARDVSNIGFQEWTDEELDAYNKAHPEGSQ